MEMAARYSNCRKIIAVARNYAAHAKELGNEVPDTPVVFLKPSSSIITEGKSIKVPKPSDTLNHEVELCLVIGKTLHEASPEEVREAITGYTVALDMTERQLQTQAIDKGYPWTIAKGFDTSCCLGPLLDIKQLPQDLLLSRNVRKNAESDNVTLWLKVNGEEKQRASTSLMIHPAAEILSYVSHFMTIEPDDLLLTGTPAGIGPCKRGDVITAGIEGHCEITFPIEK